MESKRKLSINEEKLLEFLIVKSAIRFPSDWKDTTYAIPMDDGGMGSLYLFTESINDTHRVFGKQISECIFKDTDGVTVIASLNIDNYDQLYELDIWKTDFSSLIKLPEQYE